MPTYIDLELDNGYSNGKGSKTSKCSRLGRVCSSITRRKPSTIVLIVVSLVLAGLLIGAIVDNITSSRGGINGYHSIRYLANTDDTTTQDLRTPGKVIMGKMSNETIKAELGRSSWRLLHTMAGKFPYEPTADERKALLDFIYLFARLYPCGDCAGHFRLILEKHPPDVSNRDTISQWACKVHNIVNERLKKPQFDCSKVTDIWKCGCSEDDDKKSTKV